jgi:hypothetical protein
LSPYSISGEHVVKPDRSRYVWLYLPSKAEKERWKSLAEKAKSNLSEFCISIIEERLAEEDGIIPRREVAKELETLKIENKTLREDLRQKEVVLQRYEAELRRYRSEPFLQDDYKGVRPYSEELVKVIKVRGRVDGYGLLELLGIKPNEAETIRAVSKQLEELERYGIIKADGRGWQWIA